MARDAPRLHKGPVPPFPSRLHEVLRGFARANRPQRTSHSGVLPTNMRSPRSPGDVRAFSVSHLGLTSVDETRGQRPVRSVSQRLLQNPPLAREQQRLGGPDLVGQISLATSRRQGVAGILGGEARSPRYDLTEKYKPKRAVVTVAVGPPPPEASSQGAMRSFPVSVRPPAPATKISLGSKKAEPSRLANPSPETSVQTGLPLTTTHPAGLSSEHDTARAAKQGKEKEVLEVEEVVTVKRSWRDGPSSGEDEQMVTSLVGERIACGLIQVWFSHQGFLQMAHSVTDLFARAKDGDEIHRQDVAPLKKSLAKREQRIKELEVKLKTAETGRRILERADFGEKILTDPVLLA
nr:hypothetical protein Iba_chr04cCG14660 [Ipomoea batatas]